MGFGMWICTPNGFYSIVKNTQGQGLLVRAREREHIEAFLVENELYDREVIVTPDADYPFRAAVPQVNVERWLAWQASRIGYPNFKNEVNAQPRTAARDRYLDALHDVWGVFRRHLDPRSPGVQKATRVRQPRS